MSAESWFVDANVLVCLFDDEAPRKQGHVRQLLQSQLENILLSTQVLEEFYVAVTRKLANPLTPDAAREAVDALCVFQVRSVTPALVQAAVRRSQTTSLCYWPALIIETALDAGASTLVSEDLPHGQTFDGLRVVNLFRDGV